eukprot:TRINITY_DN7169_c0_g1_i1.p2 TRINITY_DN7169_c0_g1~~TRINITY_DN7169_c0_g1_i1.p2  ORF type:complete len:106 (+),score=27.84 TRINITY_DN7169_c0_g1_i1:467-784(+)
MWNNVSKNQTDFSKMETSKDPKKLIAHANRTINYGKQLLLNNKINNFENGNKFWKRLLQDENVNDEKISWPDFKKKYVDKIYDKQQKFIAMSNYVDHNFNKNKNK